MIFALTIAGADPTGGAGLEADLRVFQSLGVHGCAVATALTTQDSGVVFDVEMLDPKKVARRIRVLVDDIHPAAVKLGMLGTRAMVEELIPLLNGPLASVPLIVDPVLISSSGATLLEDNALALMRDEILPRATVITPNRKEAVRLLGGGDVDDPEALARALSVHGGVVVVTGGDANEPTVRNFVAMSGQTLVLEADRECGVSPHGTGCTFTAAIAAHIASGKVPLAAVERAHDFMKKAVGKSRFPRHRDKLGKMPLCDF